MLSQFEEFFEAKRVQLESKDIRVEFKRRSQPSAAVNVTLETSESLVSLSAWEDGAVDVDVIDIHAGKCLLAKRYDFQTPQEMLVVVEELYKYILGKNKG